MIRSYKFPTFVIAGALAAAIALLPLPVAAQQNNLAAAAKITNTARVPGTVTQVGTLNSSGKGVFCTFQQVSEVGNPSTVISVEVEDVTSGQWIALASAAAVTASTAAPGVSSVMVYPGAVATSVPTGVAIAGLKVLLNWRLKQVTTGGTSTTGSASCDLLN